MKIGSKSVQKWRDCCTVARFLNDGQEIRQGFGDQSVAGRTLAELVVLVQI
jgi:hypothetical protein